MSNITKEEIGERFDNQVIVSPTTNSVYEITDLEENQLYFAKVWPENENSTLDELNSITVNIGLPPHFVVNGDPSLLVMKPAKGKCLSKDLLRKLLPGFWVASKKQSAKAFKNLGRAVGRLHTKTTTGTQELTPSTMSFDNYKAISNGKTTPIISKILGKKSTRNIEKEISRLAEFEVSTSLVHGDLMLFHIFVEKTNVTIIDFDAAKHTHCIEDLVRFLSALELFIFRLPYGRRSQFRELSTAFESGYHQTGPTYDLDSQAWNTLRAIRHCSLLMYYHDKLPSGSQTKQWNSRKDQAKLVPLRYIDTRILKRLIRRLVE